MRERGIFCLDIGTTSAFAYGYPGDTPVWGRRHFKDIVPGGDAGVFHAFGQWLEERLDETMPAYFCTEGLWVTRDPRKLNIKSVGRLFGLDGIAQREAHRRHIKPRRWAIDEVAQFHGTGRLPSAEKKRITRQNIIQRYGWTPVTEDEADALSLWVFAEAQLEPRSRRSVGPLFAPSREVVDARRG